jgi:CBS domain-containing protein
MRVRELMQKDVVTIGVDATLDLADDLMRVDRIRHIPVVSGKRLVGIVSQRGLLRAAVSNMLRLAPGAEKVWLAGISVREVMASEVFTVHAEASIASAVEMMLMQRIGCLPVLEDGRLVGLLSETDCLRYLDRILVNEQERRALE